MTLSACRRVTDLKGKKLCSSAFVLDTEGGRWSQLESKFFIPVSPDKVIQGTNAAVMC